MKDRLDILIMAERIRARSASEKTPKRRPCPNPLLSPVSARAAEFPVAEIHLRGRSEHDHQMFVDYSERRSPDYKDGSINLVSGVSWFRGF
jgi:hypothetical protein